MEHSIQSVSFRLDPDEVHIWWVALDLPLRSLPEQITLLSTDENARAQRFRFERHRRRYIAGRACLRRLLGGYLGLDPAQIQFDYSPQGKPSLKKNIHGKVLQFNLSNSEDRALIAFRWQHLVGVDLEYVHPILDEDDLARQFFCASETALIHSLTGDEKNRKFFELWTCKESLLKAMGAGLSRPINEVEVALQDGSARLVSIAGDSLQAASWRFALFQPAFGYQAALALEGPPCRIIFCPAVDEVKLKTSLL